MTECEGGVKALSMLCVKKTQKYLEGLILIYAYMDSCDANARMLRDAFQSIPPNFHADFLDRLAPCFDSITQSEVSQHILDFLDELAVILLSPYITQIDVDKFKFPTRNPSKYLQALGMAKSLKTFVSQRENIFKYSLSKFKLLSAALVKMPLLLYLTLRHLKISSCEINVLLEGLACSSPHLTYLDLKYSAVTDSGTDTIESGRRGHNADCIPALLKMKNLRHLNVSETWLSYVGVKAIVQNLMLERLEAIMGTGYDLQATVIKNLLAGPQDPPFTLPRTSYSIAQEERYVRSICKACPLLKDINVQYCYDMNISAYFSAFAELKCLKAITLSGLEWTLHGSHIPMDDEPQAISNLVTEVTLQEPSCVDAHSLGVLSICFPTITHLCVLGSQNETSTSEFWSRGSVFRKLTHLHYQGSLFTGDFGRIQREQGLQSIIDVLLGWCMHLRSLTLYTDYLDFYLLCYALERNDLKHLKELRIGLQRDLTVDTIMALLRGAAHDFAILGRTDWWTAMTVESRQNVLEVLKRRFQNIIVYGLDDISEVDEDPRPNSFHQRECAW